MYLKEYTVRFFIIYIIENQHKVCLWLKYFYLFVYIIVEKYDLHL